MLEESLCHESNPSIGRRGAAMHGGVCDQKQVTAWLWTRGDAGLPINRGGSGRKSWSGQESSFKVMRPVCWPMENCRFGHVTLRAETMCPVMTDDMQTKMLLARYAHELGA